jgi:formate dehydrogenase major subunit
MSVMPRDKTTDLSRRAFLKLTATGALVSSFGFDLSPALAQSKSFKIARTTETRSICPYCSVSCGVILHTRGDGKNTQKELIHVEGDPDHPINRGTLCPKGATLKHYVMNDQRLTRVLHRAPGSSAWTPMTWGEAMDRIARRVKKTRDAGFIDRDPEGRVVNRLENLAAIGGCTDTNEFNWLFQKVARGLGIVHLEQQSRI